MKLEELTGGRVREFSGTHRRKVAERRRRKSPAKFTTSMM